MITPDLSRLQSEAELLPQGKALPIETWNPPFCGDIDMIIRHDGTWLYNGTPIARPAMVRLFARILRKEDDGYFLVTPVEKVGITLEDAPFIAVEMTLETVPVQTLTFRTNVDDIVTLDAAHPMRFEISESDGFRPYIEVRNGLLARLSRDLARDLAGLGESAVHDGATWFGVTSAGIFFPIAPAETIAS